MASLQSPVVPHDTAERSSRYELTERELAILRVTRSHSKSTVTIAEEVGLGTDPGALTPLLDRLEQLALLDGFYASGRVMSSAAEDHRRYYRTSELGATLATTAAHRSGL